MHRRTTLTPLALVLLTLMTLTLITSTYAMPSVTVRGYAWIDSNCNGIREDDEPAANTVMPRIDMYSFGEDGLPFTSDDGSVQIGAYLSTPDVVYEFTRGATGYLYRLSIIQGARPDGYIPTLYRQGNDPARWSSLQSNWTTGDPSDGGFTMSEAETVTGGNIGIAPASCAQQWFSNHLYLPLLVR